MHIHHLVIVLTSSANLTQLQMKVIFSNLRFEFCIFVS